VTDCACNADVFVVYRLSTHLTQLQTEEDTKCVHVEQDGVLEEGRIRIAVRNASNEPMPMPRDEKRPFEKR
jgi:hypothetical protein